MSVEPGNIFGVRMLCIFRNSADVHAREFTARVSKRNRQVHIERDHPGYATKVVTCATVSRQDAWRAYLEILTDLKASHGLLDWQKGVFIHSVSPYDAAKNPEIFDSCCAEFQAHKATTAAVEPAPEQRRYLYVTSQFASTRDA